MDAAKIQALAYKGLGKGAKILGTDHKVYRSPSLLDPLAGAELLTIKASMTTSYGYSKASKPGAPEMMLVADASRLQSWDWLVGEQTSYLCRLQPLLPPMVIQCNRVVRIARPGYTTGPGPYEPDALNVIASSLPVFMKPKTASAASPKAIPYPTDTAAAITEWEVYINAQSIGAIQPHDVITDEMGAKYEITQAAPSDFGFMCIARLEAP